MTSLNPAVTVIIRENEKYFKMAGVQDSQKFEIVHDWKRISKWKWLSFKDVRANCFCTSSLRTAARANSHATSRIKRARWVLKWTMIGQITIAIALLGFNNLGRSVTPTFLFRNRFYLQLSPHCSKMNKKSMWEVKKISRFLSDFCPRDMESCHLAAARRVKLWSLNANLFFAYQTFG